MKKILLTRPEAFSESLAALLQAQGKETFVEPLLIYSQRNAPRPDADPPGAVMLTSRNAVAMLAGRRDEVLDLLDLPCFCVGIRTADSARAFGFRKVYEGRGDSRALANKIIQVMPPNTPLLHIVGVDRATAAGELLVRAGFVVNSWVVYKAEEKTAFSLPLQAAMKHGEIGCVLFFSPRTALVFATLAQKHGLVEACKEIDAIGISKGVFDALAPLSFASARVAEAPTEVAMMAAVG